MLILCQISPCLEVKIHLVFENGTFHQPRWSSSGDICVSDLFRRAQGDNVVKSSAPYLVSPPPLPFSPSGNPGTTQCAELMTDEPFDTEMLDTLLRVPAKDLPNKLSYTHPRPY